MRRRKLKEPFKVRKRESSGVFTPFTASAHVLFREYSKHVLAAGMSCTVTSAFPNRPSEQIRNMNHPTPPRII